jgi:hypothetical protein
MNKIPSLLPIVRAATGAAILLLGSTTIASAQTDAMMTPPAPAAAPATPPTYAAPANGETITGHITAITGKYSIQVRDNRGFVDNVALHQGTIINPTGLTLQAGMQVTVIGSNAGATFAANQIDAPYTVALVPGYGYGPYFGGIGLGFGFGGWGWGGGFRGGYLR